jgi:hypothetical protein
MRHYTNIFMTPKHLQPLPLKYLLSLQQVMIFCFYRDYFKRQYVSSRWGQELLVYFHFSQSFLVGLVSSNLSSVQHMWLGEYWRKKKRMGIWLITKTICFFLHWRKNCYLVLNSKDKKKYEGWTHLFLCLI